MRLPPILFGAFLALSACSGAKGQTVSGLYPAGALVDQTVVTHNASGDATWNYSVQFPAAPAVVHLPKSVNTSDALICNWTSITQTSVSIHCWRTNTLAALLTGLLTGSTTGLQVSLVARYIPPSP